MIPIITAINAFFPVVVFGTSPWAVTSKRPAHMDIITITPPKIGQATIFIKRVIIQPNHLAGSGDPTGFTHESVANSPAKVMIGNANKTIKENKTINFLFI